MDPIHLLLPSAIRFLTLTSLANSIEMELITLYLHPVYENMLYTQTFQHALSASHIFLD